LNQEKKSNTAMKKSPKFLTCVFLGIAMGCSDFAVQPQDQSAISQPALNSMDTNEAESQAITSEAAVSPFYDFKTLINFENDTTTWKEVQKKAKKESKPILFYGWAAWCQPCQFENAVVLGKDASLAQYLNDNFINTRFMMETTAGEHVSTGWDVVEKFNVTVTAYPIFLFFDAKGKLVYEYMGLVSSADLLAMAQGASLLKNKDKIK
jgi:thiol-disulfide isomerase/thioredoxin